MTNPRLNRARAVLALRGQTISGLSKTLGVSQQHLSEVLLGHREPSAALSSRLAAELGDQLKFIYGIERSLNDTTTFGAPEAL